MKLFLFILLTLISTHFAYTENLPEDDPYYPKYCANLNEPKCNDCCETKGENSRPDKCKNEQVESAEKDDCENSFISTLTYSYTHFATEFTADSNSDGCGPCSGGNAPNSALPSLNLIRMHKFRQMSDRGSFGMGTFMTFDIYFKLYESGGAARVDMFFAGDRNNRRYFKQGNKFYDTFARSSKELVLLDANGSITTSFGTAVKAELKSFNGDIYAFDIFSEDDGVKWGRLNYFKNNLEYSIDLNYEYEISDPVDYEDKFKLSHITDAHNRTVAFEYLPGKRMGVNVISKIILPNTDYIEYKYGSSPETEDTDDYLSQVIYPDGTTSSFVIPELVNNQTEVQIFEAGEKGTHRNKKVRMTNLFSSQANRARDGQSYFNSASLLILNVSIGNNNESSFEIYQSPSNANNRIVYQGGNKLKTVNIVSAKYYKEWSKTGTAGNFDDFTGLTTEESSSYGDWKFYSGNAQGRPPFMFDKHGLKFKYVYNGDNKLTKKIYEDGTFESWSYNELNYVTRYRDRLGRVTHSNYDFPGRPSLMTSKVVGLVAEANGTVDQEIPGLLAKVYDWTGNSLPSNFDNMDAIEITSVPNLELNVSDRDERYAMLFTGKININTTGDYNFFLSSDDGSKLYIDGIEVIDNDGLHGNREVGTTTPLTLTAGKHDIRVEFFEKYGQEVLSLSYSGPDSGELKVQIPDSAYSHITVEEELQEIDITTPETATYLYTYYPNTGIAGDNRYLLHTETDANGNVTTFTYTDSNLIEYVKTMDDDGNIDAITKSYFDYDSAKRLQSSTDARGRTMNYEYDSRDRVKKIVYNDTSTELFFYGDGNNANLLLKKKDRNGNTTKFEYDSQGRKITTIRAFSYMNEDGTYEDENNDDNGKGREHLKSIERCTYVPGTRLKATCTIDGNLTEYFYDYRNRLVETRKHADSDSILITKSFYKNNLLQWREDPYGRRMFFSYRIRGEAKADTAVTRKVQETKPGSINLNNGYYSEIDSIERDLSNNASYLVTDYLHDAEGQIVTEVDPRNIHHTIVYDSRGRATFQINAPNSYAQTVQNVYDLNSNLIEVRNPRYFSENINDITKMTFNSRNLLASRTVGFGSDVEATESITYYDDGSKQDHIDYRGNTTTTEWHLCCGRFQASIDQAGHASISSTDFYGNVTHTAVIKNYTTADMGGTGDQSVHNYTDSKTVQEITTRFDARHRPIARTLWQNPLAAVDANNVPIAGDNGISQEGFTTRWEYFDEAINEPKLAPLMSELNNDLISLNNNSKGSGIIKINPEGEVSAIIKDGIGRIIANGIYDKDEWELGNYVLVTWHTITHDTIDPVTTSNLLETKVTTALGNSTKSRNDGAERRIITIDPNNKYTSYEYDANSNLIKFRDPNGVGQDCVFDELNRDVSCTDTFGDTKTSSYDLNNNLTAEYDSKGNSQTCIFDERNRELTRTNRIDGVTSFIYDENSNILSVTDPKGYTTTYTYDVRNLEERVEHADGAIVSCTYDALKRLDQETDPGNDVITFNYDLAGRLTSRVYYEGGTILESTDSFTYDKASRVKTASKGRYSNTVSFTYDQAGRKKTSKTNVRGNDYLLIYDKYDLDNRLEEVILPSRGEASNNKLYKTWTSRNQLQSIRFNNNSIISEYKYDDGMREIERKFGNNLTSTKSYRVNQNNPLQKDNLISSINVSGNSNLSFSYSYDSNKNVTSESSNGSIMSYYNWTTINSNNNGYDSSDRVTYWERSNSNNSDYQSWTLDEVSNWTSTVGSFNDVAFNESRTHSEVHELESINLSEIEYDSNGSMTKDTHGNILAWDMDNQLKAFENVSFEYDALGRRIVKSSNNQTTIFIHDGKQVIEEYSDLGNGPQLKQSYVYGTYVDDVVAKILPTNTPTIHFYHTDRQYNVRGLSDNSPTPQILELYAYSVYGKRTILSPQGSILPNTSCDNYYGFTGRYLDLETNLWYFRSRYFSDELGRFISEDEMGFIDGFNKYAAHFAQKFNLDPSGHFSYSIHRTMTEKAFNRLDDCHCCMREANRSMFLLGMKEGNSSVDGASVLKFITIPSILKMYEEGELDKMLIITDIINGAQEVYRTHFGDLAFQHTMSFQGYGPFKIFGNTGPQDVINRAKQYVTSHTSHWAIPDWCCDFFENVKFGCFDWGFKLGIALHTIQDSFSDSHAFRVGGSGAIAMIGDYTQQDSAKHAVHDAVYDPFGENATFKYLDDVICNEAKKSGQIINEIFQLAPNATVGDPMEKL